jgi:hypothetical protein
MYKGWRQVRLPKVIMEYKPKGKKWLGRPREIKRPKCGATTGLRTYSLVKKKK